MADERGVCVSAALGLTLHMHSNKPTALLLESPGQGAQHSDLQCSTLELEVVQTAMVNGYCRTAEQTAAESLSRHS